MPIIRVPKTWQLSNLKITPEAAFLNRRRFIKSLVGVGIGASVTSVVGCQKSAATVDPELEATLGTPLNSAMPNPAFVDVGRPITEQAFASTYNNYYEFGGNKGIWRNAQKLPTENWKVDVTGLVKNPRTYDLGDLTQHFPLEERVYRFRCVEAWAMVVPWLGFPMRLLMEEVEPTSSAKFVRFSSFYDPQVSSGPLWPPSGSMPWPYTEGLRIEEMANELAFFAVGIYGRTLPKQHGAPIRMVIPWKYGFKGGKSIVKIEFVEEQPATFWNTLAPNEYAFESNVNPNVPHPRWSQATERLVGTGSNTYDWERQPTLIYNGYGEYVANLYS